MSENESGSGVWQENFGIIQMTNTVVKLVGRRCCAACLRPVANHVGVAAATPYRIISENFTGIFTENVRPAFFAKIERNF
jgi:hypothetical protein